MKITHGTKPQVTANKNYDDAMRHIQAAIDCLGIAASKDSNDKIARDSIANLGVVALDLSTNK